MQALRYSLNEIDRAVQMLLPYRHQHKVWAFYGDLGAGKTTLVTAICHALGITGEIASPTFALVNEYVSPGGPVYHFDFYRIKDPSEAFDIGYEEYFFSGNLCLVEWPSHIESLLPIDSLRITLNLVDDHTRELTVQAKAEEY